MSFAKTFYLTAATWAACTEGQISLIRRDVDGGDLVGLVGQVDHELGRGRSGRSSTRLPDTDARALNDLVESIFSGWPR